ncbi:MAG: hypothetical protein MHPSP_004818, partial [Paramarteilia canceri]
HHLASKSSLAKAKKQLDGARFRILNEKFYTNPTAKLDLTRQEYQTYIEGFTLQRKQWPIDPLNSLIECLNNIEDINQKMIADIGCGDARLAKHFNNVKSFDKFSRGSNIINCCMSK